MTLTSIFFLSSRGATLSFSLDSSSFVVFLSFSTTDSESSLLFGFCADEETLSSSLVSSSLEFSPLLLFMLMLELREDVISLCVVLLLGFPAVAAGGPAEYLCPLAGAAGTGLPTANEGG